MPLDNPKQCRPEEAVNPEPQGLPRGGNLTRQTRLVEALQLPALIPKKIHYCWFGGNPLPDSALKCIKSWEKWFPGWEIIQWNESNFDVHSIPYTTEAYNAGKYAFVSDYARFKILNEHGGVYFDTDVEAIADFTEILERGPYMGFEINPSLAKPMGAVNPGLGMSANPGMPLFEKIISYYNKLHFVLPDGSHNITDAVVNITTRELANAGLANAGGIQNVAGFAIYPADYFNPFDNATGRLRITPNTRSIHWFSKTWSNISPTREKLLRLLRRIIGTDTLTRFKHLLHSQF